MNDERTFPWESCGLSHEKDAVQSEINDLKREQIPHEAFETVAVAKASDTHFHMEMDPMLACERLAELLKPIRVVGQNC